MGMYTALHFTTALKPGLPDDVLTVLRYMLEPTGATPEPPLPNHPLFRTDRWHFMLTSDSFYFEADTHSCLVKYPTAGWGLSITCNFKNYRDELDCFLDWIGPWVDAAPGDWLGYRMYEEDDQPTQIFYLGDERKGEVGG